MKSFNISVEDESFKAVTNNKMWNYLAAKRDEVLKATKEIELKDIEEIKESHEFSVNFLKLLILPNKDKEILKYLLSINNDRRKY